MPRLSGGGGMLHQAQDPHVSYEMREGCNTKARISSGANQAEVICQLDFISLATDFSEKRRWYHLVQAQQGPQGINQNIGAQNWEKCPTLLTLLRLSTARRYGPNKAKREEEPTLLREARAIEKVPRRFKTQTQQPRCGYLT